MSKVFYHALGKTETWPNISGINPAMLTYDDVLLVPQESSISSREEVDTTVQFGPYTLTKPLISAPMDTISGEEMVRELARLGAIGSLPRGDLKERAKICARLTKDNVPCLYAVGLKHAMEEATILVKNGSQMILIDAAHGGMVSMQKAAVEIKKKLGVHVVAGNIVTYDTALALKKAHVDYLRVGVGPGGMCITRMVAGSGYPQLSAVFETTASDVPVIADGGIKKPGDFAKAMAAGACIVMVGSIFAGTDETPGDLLNGNKKMARGQASAAYMKDNKVETGEFRAAEGVSLLVPAKGPVKKIVDEYMGGLRSAMTYAGAKSIKEFQKKAQFVYASKSAQEEGSPWLKYQA